MGKRYCKHVDITNLEFIEKAVLSCLTKRCKRLRNDTIRLFAYVLDRKMKEAKEHLIAQDEEYKNAVRTIALLMQNAIQNDCIHLPRVTICYRTDGNSGKKRKITVQHIWQLLYDHLAVMAMDELNKLLGDRQVSGRKGMGISRGRKLLSKWLRKQDRKKLYFAKMDIHHYYESVDIPALLQWLFRKIKNYRLQKLILQLLNTGEEGLNIGSYLSHYCANLYLSDVYHKVLEQMPAIKFAMFYMDDMLFIGNNKRTLKKALKGVIALLALKRLQVKPNWQIHQLKENHYIDLMGYRFSKDKITLRKRIYKRTRRSMLRLRRIIRKGLKPTHAQLLRVTSYYGWTVHACFRGGYLASFSQKVLDLATDLLKTPESYVLR